MSNEIVLPAMGKHLELDESQMKDKVGKHFEKFKDITGFMEILDSIISLQCKSTCIEACGCSIAGQTHQCSALKCIKSKGYVGCWECNEYKNCEKLSFLKHSYGSVIEENLTTVKESGTEAVKSRGDKYYMWQRK